MDVWELNIGDLAPAARERLLALADEVENLKAASHRKGDVASDLRIETQKLDARVAEMRRDNTRSIPLTVSGHVSVGGRVAEVSSPGGVEDPVAISERQLEGLQQKLARVTSERDAITARLQPLSRLLTRSIDELARRGFNKPNHQLLGRAPRAEGSR